MKLKNILLSGLSLVLVAALAIGGTVAYLQDSDNDVNVMTLGNVSIEQHEYERVVNADGTYATDTIDNVTSYVLQNFTQGKALLPATESTNYGAGGYDSTVVRMTQVDSYGYMQVFESENAVDKFVTVENTGKTDAYVRTLLAFEIGSLSYDEWINAVRKSWHMCWDVAGVGIVAIDGNNYYVVECVYSDGDNEGARHQNGVLTAGETTYPSLSQVYMTATSTNETVEALDGNDNGTYDILVLSQAVQAAGFADAQTALDTAFGTAKDNAATWFGGEEFDIPTTISTADELTAALAAGEDVVLSDDVTISEDASINVTGDVVIDLAGNTLTMTAGDNSAAAKAISVFTIKDGQTLTIAGGEFVVNFGKNGTSYSDGNVQNTLFDVQAGGKLVINDGTFTATMVEDGYNLIPVIIDNNGEVEINGGSFSTNAINLFRNKNGKMTINGGTFTGVEKPLGRTDYPYTVIWNQYANSSLIVNGGTFTNIEVEKENGSVTIADGVNLSLWYAR